MSSVGVLGSLNQLNRTHSAVNNSIQKLATGNKYPSASFGASAYSILTRLNSTVGAVAQSNRNSQTTNAMLNVASGGVSSTISALSSLKEHILKAANGTNNDGDIATISKTVEQTIETVDDNASIEFNGKKLIDGSHSFVTAGVDGYNRTNMGDMTAKGLGLVDSNGKITIDLSTREGISNALDTVDNALNKALDEATSLGAAQQNLAYASANYTVQEENLLSSESTMGDTDMAAEITRMRSEDTLNALALAATKLYMHQNASVLGLLR